MEIKIHTELLQDLRAFLGDKLEDELKRLAKEFLETTDEDFSIVEKPRNYFDSLCTIDVGTKKANVESKIKDGKLVFYLEGVK